MKKETTYQCPTCKRKQTVLVRVKQVTCGKCKSSVMIPLPPKEVTP